MALIYCTACGRQISSAATNCPHCGQPVEYVKKINCPECGTSVKEGTAICPQCGYPFVKAPANNLQTSHPASNTNVDVPNGGFKVLSLFVPIAGWILAAQMARNGRPNCQAAYNKNAKIGMGAIWGGLSALYTIMVLSEM